MTISIITANLNGGQYLEETINSVISQGIDSLEYIIIDGGSTDESIDIIKKYDTHISHWEVNPGQSFYKSLNRGFELATGEILTWINSDDLLLPSTLSKITKLFSSLPEVAWITGLHCHCNSKGDITERISLAPYSRQLLKYGFYEERQLYYVQQEGTFWRKSLWEQSGAYIDTTLEVAADFELWIRFAQYEKLYSVREALAAFRYHDNNLSSLKKEQYLSEIDSIKSNFVITMEQLTSELFLHPQHFAYSLTEIDKNWKVQKEIIDVPHCYYKVYQKWLYKEYSHINNHRKLRLSEKLSKTKLFEEKQLIAILGNPRECRWLTDILNESNIKFIYLNNYNSDLEDTYNFENTPKEIGLIITLSNTSDKLKSKLSKLAPIHSIDEIIK